MTETTLALGLAERLVAPDVAAGPCIDDDCAGDRQLVGLRICRGARLERIACSCGRTWRRAWVLLEP